MTVRQASQTVAMDVKTFFNSHTHKDESKCMLSAAQARARSCVQFWSLRSPPCMLLVARLDNSRIWRPRSWPRFARVRARAAVRVLPERFRIFAYDSDDITYEVLEDGELGVDRAGALARTADETVTAAYVGDCVSAGRSSRVSLLEAELASCYGRPACDVRSIASAGGGSTLSPVASLRGSVASGVSDGLPVLEFAGRTRPFLALLRISVSWLESARTLV